MKKIGPKFEFLTPGAEKALIPIWLEVAKHLSQDNSNSEVVLWTTDFLSAGLSVRITSPSNEEMGPMSLLNYSTPAVAKAVKLLDQIYQDDFCDETLGPFRAVYENWIDYLILLSFNASSVKRAFKAIGAKQHIKIVATTFDDGLSGDVRVLLPKESKRPSPAKAKRKGDN